MEVWYEHSKGGLSWQTPGFHGYCTAGSYVQVFFHGAGGGTDLYPSPQKVKAGVSQLSIFLILEPSVS